MDYDDKEFQDQNCHVGSEGSSKFSPVLHPYALSKFDFDDSHIRFDNLVEHDVFLGIQSQEDNQWIEDFSRGSGVYSSSAPEPCPIPRSNNVWSEAASSESVAMLLKSVGQEEAVFIVEESDACQELGFVAEHMESHKEDDSTMVVTHSDAMLLTEKVAIHDSGLIDAESVSHPGTTPEKSHMSSPNALSEPCEVYRVEENLDKGNGEENVSEVDTSSAKFPVNEMQDPSGCSMHTEVGGSVSQDVTVDTGGLDNQELVIQVTDVSVESVNCLLADSGEEVKEDNATCKGVHVDDLALKVIAPETSNEDLKNFSGFSSKVDILGLPLVEINDSKLDESSSLAVTGSGDLHPAEDCPKDMCASEADKGSECDRLDTSDIHQQFDENVQDDLQNNIEDDGNSVARVVEARTEKVENSAGFNLKMCSTSEVANSLEEGSVSMQGSDSQLSTESLVCNTQGSVLLNLKNKVSNAKEDETSISSEVECTIVTPASSRTPIHDRDHSVGKSKIGDDASGVHKDLNAEDYVSPIVADLALSLNTVHQDKVVSSNGEDKPMFLNNFSEKKCDIIDPVNHEEVIGLSLNQDSSSKVNNEAVSRSECDADTSIEPEETPLLHERGARIDLTADQMGQIPKTGKESSAETTTMPLKEISQNTEKMDSVLEIAKDSASNSKQDLLPEAADHSLLVDGALDTTHENSSRLIMNMTAGHSSPIAGIFSPEILAGQVEKYHQIRDSSSNKLELFSSTCGPTTKQSANASDIPANHEAAGKDHRSTPKVSDSAVLAPTISNSNVLSKSKGEKEKAVERSLVTSVPAGGVVESTSKEVRQGDVANDGRSFTFEVPLPSSIVGVCDQDKQFFTNTQTPTSYKQALPSKPSVGPMEPETIPEPSRETFPSPPSFGPKESRTAIEASYASSQPPNLEIAHGGLTGTPVRKRGRPSGKASGKQSVRKRKSLEETTPIRQSERDENKSSMSTSLSGTGRLQLEGVKLHENFEQSSIVSSAGISVVMPNLPDLNSSASPSALFRQPFSDIQQLQLRAQIFVYGSLIQRAVPDETCMTAAFGTSDGGRNTWEPVWRAYIENLQGLKSVSKSETPLLPLSGPNPPEQTSTKKDAVQSTVLPSPVGRASSMGTPSPVLNSMIPLSSPLWNVSTPFHVLQSSGMPKSSLFEHGETRSPSNFFQTPPSRNFAGSSSFLPSHVSFTAPWFNASQSSPFDISARFPITPIRETVPPVGSGAKHSTSSTIIHHSSSSVPTEPNPLPDVKKTTLPSGQKAAELKSRKRKKITVSENLTQISLLPLARTESVSTPIPLFAQPRTELAPTPVVPSLLTASVVVSTPPVSGSKGNDARIVATTSSYVADQPKRLEPNTEQKTNLPEDALVKVQEAKQQAEDAAALATAAVSHSQTVWDQLNKQKSSGFVPEVEAKLASAAVAVAAAAAVAKAAAAAAHVAFNAASQAKMMADEAWSSSRVDNPAFGNATSVSSMGNCMGLATPSSIFKVGDEGNYSSSILVAAKEAAKKRVEAASFASRRAENLDDIVKAAELAAAAVSQAGRIVAMGDPASLAKLVEAGPEGYWRAPHVPPEQPNEEPSNVGRIQVSLSDSGGHADDEPLKKKAKAANRDMSPLSREVFKESVDGTLSSFASSEKDSRAERDSTASALDKTIGVVPESENGSRPTSITNQDTKGIETLKGTTIGEGSHVEVKKEGNGYKEAWFSADVLSIESGKAFVSYAASKSGLSQLKEWVVLEGDSKNAPRIRIPVTDILYEGSKKRRRGAIWDRMWSIGDKVDVWMNVNECWREGVITDMNEIDVTVITVHFPAEGETSIVRSWHLRPSLTWIDGEWIESSSSKQRDTLNKGDSPQEKRLKLGGPSIEESKRDKMAKTFQLPGPERPEELQILPLADNEKTFTVGNNSKKENKLDASRTVRSGLQKEGPRVVFGVPKPGKKKKYMEVSKHYGAESSNKTDKLKDKYTMSRNDAKEKQQGDFVTKIPKPGKSVSSFGRTLSQKDKVPTSFLPAKNEAKKSASSVGSESEQQKQGESGIVSSSAGAAQGSFVFSSSAISRNVSASNARSAREKRGNRAPAVSSKSAKEARNNSDADNQIPDTGEPRRSNRKIQPTSRLLEGLQSSLMLQKFPSFAHDKGHRSTPKGK